MAKHNSIDGDYRCGFAMDLKVNNLNGLLKSLEANASVLLERAAIFYDASSHTIHLPKGGYKSKSMPLLMRILFLTNVGIVYVDRWRMGHNASAINHQRNI